MHRHAYQGKKLARTAAPRRALMRGLLDSLILYERIETTQTKAKELSRVFDRMVTKAKKQNLHNYRQIQAETINPVAAEKLYKDLVNGFASRDSGYTRIIKTGNRLGDGAPMAVVEIILDDSYKAAANKKSEAKSVKPAVDNKTKSEAKEPTKKATAGASK